MAKYQYQGRDSYGVLKKGIIEANSPAEAEDKLKGQGLRDFEIKLLDTSKKEKKKGSGTKLFGGKVKEKDLAVFTRQLGAMISAGIGIADALEIIAEQTPNKTLKEALIQVRSWK